ncbi:hypothetical protein VNO77_20610 [Canavalia gladiata]|uniref:Uncharacterized protein n=1 Tax=Canavalia gladiata TaxID=3824 RepID=A0AAN9LUN7_CANGL
MSDGEHLSSTIDCEVRTRLSESVRNLSFLFEHALGMLPNQTWAMSRFFSLTQSSDLYGVQASESEESITVFKKVRGKIGLDSQEPMLLASSVKDNIAYGKEIATTEETGSARELANAAKFTDKLLQGLNTVVGE